MGDKIRRVDMVVETTNKGITKKIFYEFKSVKDVPPANFLEQFGKDLKNTDVSDLSQIKWIFDGKKAPADFKEKMLEEIKKLNIPDDVIRKFRARDKNELENMITNNSDNIFIISR